MRLHDPRLLILVTALGFSALHQAHAQAAPQTLQAPAANPLVNSITQTAVQQGALNCASRINQVTNFLGFDANAGAVLMLPASQPDQRLLPVAMEVSADGSVAYVTASFAPNQANGCGAAYDAMVYWPLACDALAAKQYPTLKRIGQVKTSITVLDGGVSTKVFLMPAGSGCVSIKKEVLL